METIKLPKPRLTGTMSVEEAIRERRSQRAYKDDPLAIDELGQLLWAGQGVTSEDGRRAAPSAGAIYPMHLYTFQASGVHRYNPAEHSLEPALPGDLRKELSKAALGQETVRNAPLVIVVTADVNKTAVKYGRRAVRYCDLEAGHIAQNIALQAKSLGLGMVTVGAFEDEDVEKLLKLPGGWRVCYVLAVGRMP